MTIDFFNFSSWPVEVFEQFYAQARSWAPLKFTFAQGHAPLPQIHIQIIFNKYPKHAVLR